MTLFWQQFRAHLTGLLIWCGVGILMSMTLASAAVPFAQEGSLNAFMATMPTAFQSMFGLGTHVSAIDGFMSIKWAATPLLMMSLYAVLMALSVITREIDRRTIDFLLSLPVQRQQVLLSRTAVMAVDTAILGGVIWAGMRTGFSLNHLTGSFGLYALVVLGDWLAAMALGGLALLSSIWLDDYSLGVKIWLGMVTGCYFLELMLKAVGVSRWGRFYSPFSYADAITIIDKGSLGWVNVIVLAAVTLLAIGLAIPAFQRKQIAA